MYIYTEETKLKVHFSLEHSFSIYTEILYALHISICMYTKGKAQATTTTTPFTSGRTTIQPAKTMALCSYRAIYTYIYFQAKAMMRERRPLALKLWGRERKKLACVCDVLAVS